MAKEYRLNERSVLYRGRKTFTRHEITMLLHKSLRKTLRRRGRHTKFLRQVDRFGEATLRWNFAHLLPAAEEKWVQLQVRRIGNTYRVYCEGPHIYGLLGKLNDNALRKRTLLVPDTEQARKERLERKRMGRESRLERKRKKREAKRALHKAAEQPRLKKSRSRAVREVRGETSRSPLLRKQLTPQFRNTPIFWQETVDLVAYALQVKSVWHTKQRRLLTGKQVAATWLLEALEKTRDTERNIDHFAQLKCGDFYVRFDVVEHKGLKRWRGDLTLFTVSCSKGSSHPAYRRLRRRLRQKLLGLPLNEQKIRWHNANREDTRRAA